MLTRSPSQGPNPCSHPNFSPSALHRRRGTRGPQFLRAWFGGRTIWLQAFSFAAGCSGGDFQLWFTVDQVCEPLCVRVSPRLPDTFRRGRGLDCAGEVSNCGATACVRRSDSSPRGEVFLYRGQGGHHQGLHWEKLRGGLQGGCRSGGSLTSRCPQGAQRLQVRSSQDRLQECF